MKITVAMRVIGGFAIISLLLIFISVSSLIYLNDVKQSTERVSQTAVPTLEGSAKLETSFLTMGLLSTDAYFGNSLAVLSENGTQFQTYQESFATDMRALKQVLSDEPQVRSIVADVEASYGDYISNVNRMYENRRAELEINNQISSKIGDIEDNADDASTYLLDFADLDEVQSSASLRRAAETGSELESALLSLLTVAAEYAKTDSLIRAETIGNEVELVIQQVTEHMNNMQSQAGGRDDSGTLDEIVDLVNTVVSDVTSSSGILALQVTKIERGIEAREALQASETNIESALEVLKRLLDSASAIADNAKDEVASGVSTAV